jgi:hypothetical protein
MGDRHPIRYEIRLQGHLSSRRIASLGALEVTYDQDGHTTLIGQFRDQAALHGLLGRLRDLGVSLVSINPVAMPGSHRQER